MARPNKDGIDYFPFDVDFFADIKARRVKKDCGPASISVLICLLCNIYRDGYYIWWNEDLPFVIAETTGVAEGAVQEIINKAAQVGFFDENLLNKYKILTSRGIQKRYINVIKASKLKRSAIFEDYDLLHSSEETSKSSEESSKSSEETSKSSEESTQSKAKKRKEYIMHFFENIWEHYPNKKGKGQVSGTQKAKLYTLGTETLLCCIERYKKAKPEWQEYQNGSTFFNSGYIDYLDENYAELHKERGSKYEYFV